MAQLAIAGIAALAGDALITAPILGVSGAGIGWAVGSVLASYLLKPEYEKPPVGDLTAPDLQYGAALPRVWGTVATGGWLAWMSTKRATEETTEVGKGGSDTVTTGYSYSADMMFIVASESGDNIKLLRVWRNGKLVYSQVAGADSATYAQSNSTDTWDAIEIRDGNSTQTPWPIYEAAVGTADAIAYRRRTTICITNARFGNSPSPPAYLFEIATEATSAPGDVFWLLNFDGTIGSTTFLDTSSWSQTVSGTLMQQDTPAAYGSTAAYSQATGGGGSQIQSTGASIPWTIDDDLTLECRLNIASDIDQTITLMGVVPNLGSGYAIEVILVDAVSPDEKWLQLNCLGATVLGDAVAPPLYPLPVGVFNHLEIGYEGASKTARLYVNGAETLSVVVTSPPGGVTAITDSRASYSSSGTYAARSLAVDGVRFTRRVLRHTTSFTPPSTAPVDDGGLIYTPGLVSLKDVVDDICLAAPPLTSSLIATSSLASATVRGFAAVGSPRQALEQLASAYFFSSHSTDALNFILRGGSSLKTIPYADLGAGVDSAADEVLTLSRGNNNEIPRKIALKYTNWNADHEPGSVTGDRGDGLATQVETTELALVLTPEEAQKIADAWAMDRRSAATSLRPSLSDYYLELTPTDVITLTDDDDATYRVRIVADDYSAGVHAFECVLDDASVFTQPGIATDYTTPTTSLALNSDTTLQLMDIPSLRDADLYDSGYYLAVARSNLTGSWLGAAVSRSLDDSTYTSVISVTSEAGMGIATTVLGNWTGGNLMDYKNRVTVSINGAAPSFTDDQVIAGTDLVWVIGNEIIEARTATMVSPGIYTLSNLLRGRLGTEDFMASHVINERVVALEPSRIRRIAGDAADLDVLYYYRAPSYGRSLSTAGTITFTNTGRSLHPLSPASVEIARDGSNNASITVYRRTRRTHRFLTAGIQPPLGESVEAYEADVYADGTYATVVRTLSASGTNVLTYSAANQSSDGLTPGNTIYLSVYQMSSVVGRGIEKRVAA